MKVKDLPETFAFISNYIEIETLRNVVGIDTFGFYDSYFHGNDKYYGIHGIVPELEKEVTQLLTSFDRANYVRHPYYCPYCNSDKIEATGFSFDDFDDKGHETTTCLSCNRSWTDAYRVYDIQEHLE